MLQQARRAKLRKWVGFLLVLSVCACSVGNGEGEIGGVVSAPDCKLAEQSFDLKPTFFAAEVVEEMLEIRVQRGSDIELVTDGITLLVRNTTQIQQGLLDTPIDLADPQAPIAYLNIYFNRTCPTEPGDVPVNFGAISGTVSFRSIYAPKVSGRELEIAASLRNVVLVDPANADTRRATLNGDFRFLYNRGRPAQRFP